MKKKELYQNRKTIVILAALCTFLWGCAFPAVKIGYRLFEIAAEDVASQMLFAGIRFFTAGVVTLIAAAVSRKRLPKLAKKVVPGAVLLGLVQTGMQYLFFYVGLAHTTGVRGSILNATSTFFTVILSGIVWRNRDRLTPQKLLGCLIGFAGVLIVNLGGSLSMQGISFLGDGFVLLSSLSLAFGSVLTKIVAQDTDSMTLTGWQLSIGGLVLLCIGSGMGGRLLNMDYRGILLLAFMVMISSVAFSLFTNLYKYNPVSRISVFNFLIPVFGVILSSLFLGEGFPGITSVAALVLVCAGIVLVNREAQ